MIMGRETVLIYPSLARQLKAFGQRLMVARLARSLSITVMAQRSGVTRTTYKRLEEGHPSASLCLLVTALKILGTEKELDKILENDQVGLALATSSLPVKRRQKNVPKI